MVKAALCGAIDFSKAEFLSRQWWIKLRFILNELETQQVIEFFKLQHNQHCAVLSYQSPDTTFSKHWDDANKLISQIFRLQFPWYGDEKQSKQKQYSQMIDQWEKIYGNRKDPKVKEWIKRVADALHKKARKHADSYGDKIKKLSKLFKNRSNRKSSIKKKKVK